MESTGKKKGTIKTKHEKIEVKVLINNSMITKLRYEEVCELTLDKFRKKLNISEKLSYQFKKTSTSTLIGQATESSYKVKEILQTDH